MSGDSPKDRDDLYTTFRSGIPGPVRIYDYLLGGKDNGPPGIISALLALFPRVAT